MYTPAGGNGATIKDAKSHIVASSQRPAIQPITRYQANTDHRRPVVVRAKTAVGTLEVRKVRRIPSRDLPEKSRILPM